MIYTANQNFDFTQDPTIVSKIFGPSLVFQSPVLLSAIYFFVSRGKLLPPIENDCLVSEARIFCRRINDDPIFEMRLDYYSGQECYSQWLKVPLTRPVSFKAENGVSKSDFDEYVQKIFTLSEKIAAQFSTSKRKGSGHVIVQPFVAATGLHITANLEGCPVYDEKVSIESMRRLAVLRLSGRRIVFAQGFAAPR